MLAVKVKDLKKGDFFTLKPIEEPKETQVYIRGDYDRSIKKFCCDKFWDISEWCLLNGDKIVYTDFYF